MLSDNPSDMVRKAKQLDTNFRPLPDRFIDTYTGQAAWSSIYPTKNSFRQLMNVLLSVMDLPRDMKKEAKASSVIPTRLVSAAFFTETVREGLYMLLDDATVEKIRLDNTVNRLLQHDEKLNALMASCDYDATILEQFHLPPNSVHEWYLAAAHSSVYKVLSPTQKDRLDLSINLYLCMIQHDVYARYFLENHPHICERQQSFYEQIKMLAEQAESSDGSELESMIASANVFFAVCDKVQEAAKTLQMQNALSTEYIAYGELVPALTKLIHDDSPFSITNALAANINFHLYAGHKSTAECFEALRAEIEIAEVFPVEFASAVAIGYPTLAIKHFDFSEQHVDAIGSLIETLDLQSLRYLVTKFNEAINKSNDLLAMRESISSAMVSGKRLAETKDALTELTVQWSAFSSTLRKIVEEWLAHHEVACKAIESANKVFALPFPLDYSADQLKLMLDDSQRRAINLESVVESHVSEISSHLAQIEYLDGELKESKEALHAARVSAEAFQLPAPVTKTTLSQAVLRRLLRESKSLTPLELLESYQAIAPERLVVLPCALESAKLSESFGQTTRLSEMIDALIFEYLDDTTNGVPDAVSRKRLGSSFAANESISVMANQRLRAMREFSYEGEKMYLRKHVGVGSAIGASTCIRLYFFESNGKIVIPYCGPHLETATSS